MRRVEYPIDFNMCIYATIDTTCFGGITNSLPDCLSPAIKKLQRFQMRGRSYLSGFETTAKRYLLAVVSKPD